MARIQTPQAHGSRWRIRMPGTRQWVAFDTEQAAADQLDTWRREARHGQLRHQQATAGAGPTLDEFYATWTHDRILAGKTVATRNGQRHVYVKWIQPKLGHLRLRHIDAEQLRKWLAWMHTSNAGAAQTKNSHTALSAILSAAVNQGKLLRNPLHEKGPDGRHVVPVPRLNVTQARSCSWDEVQLLMKHSERLALLLRTIAEAGLRASEACGLDVNCLRLDSSAPHIIVRQVVEPGSKQVRLDTKNRDGRRVPISADLAAALREHVAGKGPRQPVFTNLLGQRWGVNGLGKAFRLMREASPLAGEDDPITLHDLRHYGCTAWFEAGIPPQAIMEWMGHADLKTTMTYAHTTDSAAALARSIVR